MALIMLPLIAAVGMLGGVFHAEHSIASAAASIAFFALAVFMFTSVLRLVRESEGPEH